MKMKSLRGRNGGCADFLLAIQGKRKKLQMLQALCYTKIQGGDGNVYQ